MEFHGTTATTATTTPRPGTPDSDPIAPVSQPPQNPFASPYGSMPASAFGSSTALQAAPTPRYFHSRRIVKAEVEKPWLEKKDPKEKWVTIIPIIGILVGLGLCAVYIWDGLRSVENYAYCPVYVDDFSSGVINASVWQQEVEVGGFGNGQFEETTNDGENAFIRDGMLILKPTLQNKTLVETNNVINLTATGQCTAHDWQSCVTATNTTNGTIVNPVKSARMNTRLGASIKYGRIEVEAKLPAGDWLWPAIWMLPTNSVYGPWPASGEIDIMESRGNNYTYPQGGDNIISSTLHWGPTTDTDQWWQNNNKHEALHTTYAADFHTYGVEWSPKYVFTFIDSRLAQVLYVKFNEPFWNKGDFPYASSNGSKLNDPWPSNDDAAPFDQDFFLILNVAVGGTNGWFEDGVDGKPWVDSSPTAKLDFWNARDQWEPTWTANGAGEMQVKSVKIYQQTGYNGCNA